MFVASPAHISNNVPANTMCVRVCTSIYIYIYIYLFIYVYINAYIHIHTKKEREITH